MLKFWWGRCGSPELRAPTPHLPSRGEHDTFGSRPSCTNPPSPSHIRFVLQGNGPLIYHLTDVDLRTTRHARHGPSVFLFTVFPTPTIICARAGYTHDDCEQIEGHRKERNRAAAADSIWSVTSHMQEFDSSGKLTIGSASFYASVAVGIKVRSTQETGAAWP